MYLQQYWPRSDLANDIFDNPVCSEVIEVIASEIKILFHSRNIDIADLIGVSNELCDEELTWLTFV